MTQITEIDAMKEIDQILSQIKDPITQQRILDWAYSKYSLIPQKVTTKKKQTKPKKSAKKKQFYSVVKDLNLKPNGKSSFREFIENKKPNNRIQKCLVSVYYLKSVLEIKQININHIYTCHKDSAWRLPSDLTNLLRWIASQKGWLDTSSKDDIRLTAIGENFVDHNLPSKKGK